MCTKITSCSILLEVVPASSSAFDFCDPMNTSSCESSSITNSRVYLKSNLIGVSDAIWSFPYSVVLLPSCLNLLNIRVSSTRAKHQMAKVLSFRFNISPSAEHLWNSLRWACWFSSAVQGLSVIFQHHSSKNINLLAFKFLQSKSSHPYMMTETIAWLDGP